MISYTIMSEYFVGHCNWYQSCIYIIYVYKNNTKFHKTKAFSKLIEPTAYSSK